MAKAKFDSWLMRLFSLTAPHSLFILQKHGGAFGLHDVLYLQAPTVPAVGSSFYESDCSIYHEKKSGSGFALHTMLARHLFDWPSQRSGWIFGILDVTLIPAREDFNG